MKHETFEVVGLSYMEEKIFARCTTYEKAQKAISILEAKGIGYNLDIVQISVMENVLNIDGELIEL